MKYWHGGAPRLAVILPSAVTGATPLIPRDKDPLGLYNPNRVYVTTDRNAAVMYAAVHPSGQGTVYEVDPHDLQHDPDCSQPGLSFSAVRARVKSARRLKPMQIDAVRWELAKG